MALSEDDAVKGAAKQRKRGTEMEATVLFAIVRLGWQVLLSLYNPIDNAPFAADLV